MAGPTDRSIVFDFGNVIALFDHMVACHRLAALSRSSRDPDDVYERIFKTSLEEDYDCGRLSTASFIARLRRDLQLDASDEAIAEAWCDIFTPNPPIEAMIVREKHRGTRLVLASNTNELHCRWFSRVFKHVVDLFDADVFSFEIGARKPAVRFFEACILASGCAPDQIIYVDDRPDYVAAAGASGMRAFVYDPTLPPPAF